MIETTDKEELIEQVAQSCRIMGGLDLTHSALGHVSVRLGDSDTMLIKARGPARSGGLRYTEPSEIIEIDFNAKKVWGPDDLLPPGESYIHTWLYKKRPEIRSIVHVHPESAVLLTITEREIYPILGSYGRGAQLAIDGVRTYPYGLVIDNDRLGEEFAGFMGDSKVALMRAHGVTCIGSSIQDATVRAIDLDQLTTMMYKAYAIGLPCRLPDDQIELLNSRKDRAEQRGGTGGETRMLNHRWNYYSRLIQDSQRPIR